ncbi:MAG: DUF1307 domain-containing protein [Bacilli bacterium]|nr:DUF1307 domain-containing protein [Bacilli bacterium]
MKKIISLCFVILFIFLLTGCEAEKNGAKKVKQEKGEEVIKCTRTAAGMNNATASLNYTIYYKGDYVTKSVSIERVKSSDSSVLDQYESAYKKVFQNYKDIDYYDNTVDRTSDTVTSTTVINYEKVDTSKILELEGENANVYEEDGKVKKDTLVSFFKKYGAKCE